ncbi:MAG: phage/plasmid primase, P4 family [Clostridia bacterium]|jgi:putative DNA primase/helicase|nr:phage/plasmid primase, P4 family [Clostridia bacterium]
MPDDAELDTSIFNDNSKRISKLLSKRSEGRDTASAWYSTDNKHSFLPYVFRDRFMEDFKVTSLNGRIVAYFDDRYISGDEPFRGLINYMDDGLNISDRKEVFSRICEMIALYKIETPESPAHFIRFKHKVLDVRTMELHEPDEYHIYNILPWDYDAEAYNEDVDKMLDAISVDNKDTRRLIEEMMGYCIFRSLKFRKFFILLGGVRNGKSTFLNMLQYTLGTQNVSNLSLHSYAGKYDTIKLYGMLTNIGDDISDCYIEETDNMKKLISGEPVKGEEKYERSFFFRPYATSIFSANVLPKMNDASNAMMDRIILIPFEAYFSEEDADMTLEDRIMCRSGAEYMLKLAVDGLKRLLARGAFDETVETKEAKSDMVRSNDHISDWLSNYDPLWKSVYEVWNAYNDYCISNGITKNVFQKSGLTKRINASLNTRKHQYSNNETDMIFEPRSTSGLTPTEIRSLRSIGWTGRKHNDRPDEPCTVRPPIQVLNAQDRDKSKDSVVLTAFNMYKDTMNLHYMDSIPETDLDAGTMGSKDVIAILLDSGDIIETDSGYVYNKRY